MRHWMKKAISLSLALLMLLTLVACGGNNKGSNTSNKSDTSSTDKGSTSTDKGSTSSGGDVSYKERLVIAYSNTLVKIDPHSNNTLVNGHIYDLTHNTLVGQNYETNEIIPELAESWEVDGLTYTFHLRDDVTFYEGQKFTAKDVIFTYERAAGTSYQLPRVQDIESMEAIDDYTLKITLSKPNAEFLELLVCPNMIILCSETTKMFDASAVEEDEGCKNGTGAFHLIEWVPDDYCLLTRNDNYWGELPKTKEILYRKTPEPATRVIALQTGEVDICLDVPAIEYSNVDNADGCSMLKIPGTKLVYMAMNVVGPNDVLRDPLVRKAVNHAINTEELIVAMTEGNATPANGVIPANIWGYSDSVTTYEHDVEKAKALLTEAGYPNGVEFTLSYDGAIYPGLFEIIQAQLAEANITLTLSTDDKTILSDQRADKSFHSAIGQWSYSTIDNSLRSLWYTGASSSLTRVAEPELDKMLDDALMEMDSAKRLAIYAEISEYLSENAAQVPLYIDTLLYGVRDNVEGYVFNGNGRHDFTYACAVE